MKLTVFPEMEQRSPEWFAARCGIVTASVVGRLLTPTLKVADNDTARGITAGLVAERITGQVEETPMTPDMWRGVEHEPYARDIYAGHHGEVVECGFMRSDSDDWTLGYSPDGLVGDDGLIEIKCPRAKGHLLTVVTGRVPDAYMAQLQAGLLVSGRQWIDYVSFHAGMPFFVTRVLPDLAWQTAIVAACRAFEVNATALASDYAERATNLPATERIDMEISI